VVTKPGPCTTSSSVTWELVSNANSQTSPRKEEILGLQLVCEYVSDFFFPVLQMELRASGMLNKCSTTKLHSSSNLGLTNSIGGFYFFFSHLSLRESRYVAQAGLELEILLP
jgi:hypothetical protein